MVMSVERNSCSVKENVIMRKLLSISLLALMLALTTGCGSDEVLIDITPNNVTLVTGEATFFTAVVKNTEVNLPTDAAGVYRKIGTLGIQYTAPDQPGDYDFEITAVADKNKKAKATIHVKWAPPVGTVLPSNALIFQTGTARQFSAIFKETNGASPVVETPKFSVTDSKDVSGRYVRYDVADVIPPGKTEHDRWDDWVGTIDENTGIFTPNPTANGSARILAKIKYNGDEVVATGTVRVRPESTIFQWITIFDLPPGATDRSIVMSRPWIDGNYMSTQVQTASETSRRQIVIDKNVGTWVETRFGADMLASPNVPLPIKLRDATGGLWDPQEHQDDKNSALAEEYLPKPVIAAVPTSHTASTAPFPDFNTNFGDAHPFFTGSAQNDTFAIGVFDTNNVQAFPPAAILSLVKWCIAQSCTHDETGETVGTGEILRPRRVVLNNYSITNFNYVSSNVAKVMVGRTELSNPDDPDSWQEQWALGYFDGSRIAVRQINPSNILLQGKTVRWHSGTDPRNYFTDLLFDNFNSYIAIGASYRLGAMDQYYQYPGEYWYGLAIQNGLNPLWDPLCYDPYYQLIDEDTGEVVEEYDPTNERCDPWPDGTTRPDVDHPDYPDPELPELEKPYDWPDQKIIQVEKRIPVEEITGLDRFRFTYVVRDPDGSLIVVGYGRVGTGLVGFAVKTYGVDFSPIE